MRKQLLVKTTLLAFFLFTNMLLAQNKSSNSKISIGEEVPNFKFTKMVNYPKKEVELKDLKDKLVITDGWAMW